MEINAFTSWFNFSEEKFEELKLKSPSLIRMSLYLLILRIIFGILSIISIVVLITSLLANYSDFVLETFSNSNELFISRTDMVIVTITSIIIFIFSAFSLWLIKISRERIYYIFDMIEFMDNHFKDGRKIINSESFK